MEEEEFEGPVDGGDDELEHEGGERGVGGECRFEEVEEARQWQCCDDVEDE